ncbi:MAG: glycosyltransferase [Bacteroidota bacterium]
MKILTIIQRYPPAVGGSETWCQEVCRYLAGHGHDVTVLTMNVNKEEEFWRDPADRDRTIAFGKFEFDHGVKVRRFDRSLPIHHFYHLVYRIILDKIFKVYFYGPHSVEMYGKMWRYIKATDVVFLNTAPYPHNFFAMILAKYFKKKIAFVPHFHPGHPHYERRSNYWLMKKSDAVIADSEFEKDYIAKKGVSPDKIFVAGCGIHPEDYQPIELDKFRARYARDYGLKPSEKIITFLGRKMPDKGVDTLIEAMRQIYPEYPVKVFLVGPTFEWFKEYYAKLSSADKASIIDLGLLSHQDKVNLLSISDLMALPSRYEAFGIVFLEAWICGTPVLGTTEGAMPNIIGKEGILSRYGDVLDLKNKLLYALKDAKSLERMGRVGREKVLREYTWNTIGKKAEDVLKATYGKKKIIFCANAYPPNFIGGAELIAHYQAKEIKKKGNDVLIFAGYPTETQERHSVWRDEYEGLPVVRVALHPKDYSSEYFNFVHKEVEARFAETLDSFAPDVVHFHNITGLSAGLIHAAGKRHIKTVVTLHDHWGFCLNNTLLKPDGTICDNFANCTDCLSHSSSDNGAPVPIRLRKDYLSLTLGESDLFLPPSNYLACAYRKAGFQNDKIKVISYGIDVERYASLVKTPANGFIRFTFIGYLGRHKGVHVIFEALPFLKHPDRVKINIVGTGDRLESYKKQVKEMGFETAVNFFGMVENNNIEEIFRQTDVLILASIWPENQPVTITEAMAARTPVIASRIGGIPEIVTDGKTGYLFDAGNARQLAGAMDRLIDHPDHLKTFGENAYRIIQTNTFESQTRKILAEYEPGTNGAHSAAMPLVVCAGSGFSKDAMDALDLFTKKYSKPVNFVMADWMDNDQMLHAKIYWVVDPQCTLQAVLRGLLHKIPLLVPEGNAQLRNLCVQSKCGLYYTNPAEAAECLEYLLSDNYTSAQLGQNGFKFISS